jgi:hypothetical protein
LQSQTGRKYPAPHRGRGRILAFECKWLCLTPLHAFIAILHEFPSISGSRNTTGVPRSGKSNFAPEGRSTWRFEKKRGGDAQAHSATVKFW